MATNEKFDMAKLNASENRDLSRMLTHKVVKEITKTANEVNFVGFETRVRQMIISLMEQPIRKIQ